MTPASEKFLAAIQSNDVETRYNAWFHAGDADPEVIPQLGRLLVASEPAARKAADEALKRIVHSVGKENSGAKHAAVVKQLIALTADGQATWTRTMVLRHLSVIGGDESVPAAARLLRNPELQEEAAFCLERIPGRASTQALIAAMPMVSDAFKPRILNALGHRRDAEAVEIAAGAMASPDRDIQIAGMRALGRIGKRPSGDVKVPDLNSLAGWQKIDYVDSALRYAEAQIKEGAPAEAIKIYRDLLDNAQEHIQCAAIIGLGKSGTPEAAALIFSKLKSKNNTVRITASKVWAAMAKA